MAKRHNRRSLSIHPLLLTGAILFLLTIAPMVAVAQPGPVLLGPSNSASDVLQPITFRWHSIEGATQYELQLTPDLFFITGVLSMPSADTQYTLPIEIDPSTTYYWRVRTFEVPPFGPPVYGDWSSTWSFTTGCPLPETPVLLNPPDGDTTVGTFVTLEWNAAENATEYDVDLYNIGGDLLFDQRTSSTSLVVTGLDYGVTYVWVVRAANECGESNLSAWRTFSSLCTSIDAPSLISPANGAEVTEPVTLDWSDVGVATGYYYEMSAQSDFLTTLLDGHTVESNVSIDVVGHYNEAIYWRVRAENNCGSGDWSNTGDFINIPDNPPIAIAGADFFAGWGDMVILDGSLSFDSEDGSLISFRWVAPRQIELQDSLSDSAWFVAPENVSTVEILLTVTDSDGNSTSDPVMVTILEDTSHAIFVSSNYGNDFFGDGSMHAPFYSLSKGISTAADGMSGADIYVQEGDYVEDSTLELANGVSLYGGFEVTFGFLFWKRMASTPTRILGAATAVSAAGISEPTVIDGFTIISSDGTDGGTYRSLANSYPEGGFYVGAYGPSDINDVWLYYCVDVGNCVQIPLTTDLSPFQGCVLGPAPDYNSEMRVSVAKRHDPADEPKITPTHMLVYVMFRMCFPADGDPLYWDPTHSGAFAPGVVHFEGHTLVRETMFLWQDLYTEFQQVTRGPDGQLYHNRPAYPYDGPNLMEPGYRSRMYDHLNVGLTGENACGIYLRKCSSYLRITNNIIEVGRGGSGGNGGDGGDGGAGGAGADGGHSTGIHLVGSSPVILWNTIRTAGGGDAGAGTPDQISGNGGNSCGVHSEQNAAPIYEYETLVFDIGPGGAVPVGIPGTSAEFCPPPSYFETNLNISPQSTEHIGIALNPLEHPVDPQLPLLPPIMVNFNSSWPGSDVEMTLVAPSGRIIDRSTEAPDVIHENGPTHEFYQISNPEVGDWSVELYGADIPALGESVTVRTSVVNENPPPVVYCPSDTTLESTSSGGAFVHFEVDAVDDCDCPLTIESTPSSGSVFPIGVTEVICTATDPDSAVTECRFNVTVNLVAEPDCCVGTRGDVNGDGQEATILDITYLVDNIFRGGPDPSCSAEADVNEDTEIGTILDLTFLVDNIFRGGPLPPACP